jgi:uncharacterized membrane protein YdjX (TVP38/TMEM64 family)
VHPSARLDGPCYKLAGMTSTKRALLVLMCALLVPIVPFAMIGELPGERWLNSAGSDSVRFGSTGAGLLALDLLLPIPSSIIGALLGGRLGFVTGGLWCFLGLFVGHCIGYALGRLTPERWTSGARGQSSASWIVLLLSRPIPVFAEALALAAGAERMPLSAFVGSVAIGDATYAAALAADGAALLPEGSWGIGLLLPMLLPVVGYLAWRKLVLRPREPGR